MESLFKEYEGIFKEEDLPSKDSKTKKEFEYAYSPFALQDALGERSAKNIWIEYNKLINKGIDPEDLIHKIIGKVREMSAINQGASQEDLAIKDFPFKKSKGHLKNWSREDLQIFYEKLVKVYHYSRMGGEEIGVALEKLILSLV